MKNPSEYDLEMSRFKTVDDWEKVPHGDFQLFQIFGTVAPSVLRCCHRLIPSDSSRFRLLLTAVGSNACNIGEIPPTMAATGPDFGLDRPFGEKMKEWAKAANQRYLLERVEQFKFASSPSVVCSAELDDHALSKLLESDMFAGIFNGVRDSKIWYNSLAELVKECGWFYVSLPEITQYDLFVFKRQLPVMEKLGSESGMVEVKWMDERAYWPHEG